MGVCVHVHMQAHHCPVNALPSAYLHFPTVRALEPKFRILCQRKRSESTLAEPYSELVPYWGFSVVIIGTTMSAASRTHCNKAL